MVSPLSDITANLRNQLAPFIEQTPWTGAAPARELMGERTQIYQGTVTALQGFGSEALQGLTQMKQMQILVEQDALDKVIKMNLSGLPGLQAIVGANLMQHNCGINHTQMLMFFERACMSFEEKDIDTAKGIFIALLFLNPLIAALWYCVAKAFETKGDLQQSLFCYAICDLLTRGDLFVALDATECLIAAGNKKLADQLLREVNFELQCAKFPAELVERAAKLRKALESLPS